MRRDLDLVRSILIYVEKADGPVDANDLVDGANDFNKVSYHVMLMANRGLLDLLSFQQDVNHDVTDLHIAAVTWDGLDYLDSIRDPKVWAKVKKTVKEAVGSTTFEVVKQTGALVAMSMVKASLGV